MSLAYEGGESKGGLLYCTEEVDSFTLSGSRGYSTWGALVCVQSLGLSSGLARKALMLSAGEPQLGKFRCNFTPEVVEFWTQCLGRKTVWQLSFHCHGDLGDCCTSRDKSHYSFGGGCGNLSVYASIPAWYHCSWRVGAADEGTTVPTDAKTEAKSLSDYYCTIRLSFWCGSKRTRVVLCTLSPLESVRDWLHKHGVNRCANGT